MICRLAWVQGKGPCRPVGAFLTEQGTGIDDTIIFELEESNYLAVVSTGMGGTVAQHLTANMGSSDVDIIDLTDTIGKLDLQGSMSARIMKKVFAAVL